MGVVSEAVEIVTCKPPLAPDIRGIPVRNTVIRSVSHLARVKEVVVSAHRRLWVRQHIKNISYSRGAQRFVVTKKAEAD